MAENKQVKSNRDRYTERLKKKYPDREYADDEALFGQINDDYDSYDKDLADMRGREDQIKDLFASNPRSAAFFMDWVKGEEPLTNLVRKFGSDFVRRLDDPDIQGQLADASKEYLERVTKEKEYEAEYEKNMDETAATIERLKTEEGLSEDDIDRAVEFLTNIYKDAVLGKYTAESILMAHRAVNHDTDVEAAGAEGEARGRNAKIEERLRKRGKGDGTATLAGRGIGSGSRRPSRSLGALDDFGDDFKTAWDRE